MYGNVMFTFVLFWGGAILRIYAAEVLPLTHSSYIDIKGYDAYILREKWTLPSVSGQGGVSDKCMEYLKRFSNATASFINCTITNARPLHYCERCVAEYISVENSYSVIFKDEHKNGSISCKGEILRADNIQVVFMTYNFATEIWDKSNCDVCFNVTIGLNNTIKYIATNSTKNLLTKINEVLECFANYSDHALPTMPSNNQSVCTMCKDLYCDANTYYVQVENEGKLCSDLIDSMNYTRINWGKTYHCTVALPDQGEIWGITAFVCAMPVLLYVGVWIHAKRVRTVPVYL